MTVSFTIDDQEYYLKTITLHDHYIMQTEIILNETPGFYIVSYLSGCPEEELRDLTVEQWDKIWNAVQVYLQDQNDSTKAPSPIMKVKGKEYGMANFDKMSIGEFADLDVIMSSKDFENKVHEAIAILYRPITVKHPDGSYEIEKYNIDGFQERAETFKHFPISEVRRAIGFFLGSALQSIKATLISLQIPEEAKKKIPDIEETIQTLLKHLDELGTELSLPSLEVISSISTWQVQRESKKHSTISLTHQEKPRNERWSIKKLIKNINFN